MVGGIKNLMHVFIPFNTINTKKKYMVENHFVLQDDDLDEDGEPRRPFRRRTLSISSRMSRLSTVSQSSTVRPLAANPAMQYELTSEIDSESEVNGL